MYMCSFYLPWLWCAEMHNYTINYFGGWVPKPHSIVTVCRLSYGYLSYTAKTIVTVCRPSYSTHAMCGAREVIIAALYMLGYMYIDEYEKVG